MPGTRSEAAFTTPIPAATEPHHQNLNRGNMGYHLRPDRNRTSNPDSARHTSHGAVGKRTLTEAPDDDAQKQEGDAGLVGERAARGHQTSGGTFAFSRYDAFDSRPGKDVWKTCGIDITVLFTPNKTVVSDRISFVQIMKVDAGGAPLLFPNEKPRATDAQDGDAGWAVDRLAGNKYADYQIGNDGRAVPGWGQIGHRNSDVRDATLEDGVRLPRAAGQTFKVEATSFALDKTNEVYLGGVSWGYEVDAKGKLTRAPAAIQSMGDPAGIQKRALERWNEQAVNPDRTKRNHDDQQPIKVP
jgi:hypothetical protein